MTDNEYKCAMCGGVFTKGLSEQEAMTATQQYWPGMPQEELEVVCVDCWQEIHPDTHPVEYAESLHDGTCTLSMPHVQQTIAKMSQTAGKSGVVEGTLREAPLQIEQESKREEQP